MEEINVTNVAEEAIENTATEFDGSKIAKASVVVLCVGAAVAGIVIARRKLKDKIEKARTKKMIEKLEKQGYTIIEAAHVFNDDDEEPEEVNPEKE